MVDKFEILSGVLAFVISTFGVYVYIKFNGVCLWRDDPNKPYKREVLTGGGIPVLFALTIVYVALGVKYSQHSLFFFGLLITTFMGSFFGFIDDVRDVKIWKKVPIMLIPPIPFVIINILNPLWNNTTVLWINWGLLYWILIIPVVYMGFSNGANIIAGYDGLEVGIYILILLLYIFIGIILNNSLVLHISIPLMFALLAFELYNLYPSKVLLGNVGSFPIGGLLGIIPFVGHFEIVLPIVFLPHLVEFLFKVKYKGHTSVFGIVDENGIIRNKDGIKSVLHWLISWGNMTEKKITLAMLGIESILCIVAFFSWYIFYII
ncbi:glycosyl transferase, group 4 family protein [Aciduliprofundum boonei T469]|nr:glycosyl transferase, group 4 family protein [Aciduliprofundum boonei T469]